MARRIAKRTPDSDKTRFELRFDADLYKQIQTIADEAQISVNQFMQGISRWAVTQAHVGEGELVGDFPHYDVKTNPQSGCVWFGNELEVTEGVDENGLERIYESQGEIYFQLDFTERHVVRDTFRGRIRQG